MSKGETGFRGFRFRERGIGTPNKPLALAQRGQGGSLSIGGGKYAMMPEADAALPVEGRARLIAMRQPVQILEIGATQNMTAAGIIPLNLDMLVVPGAKIRAM
ncbi:MAG: hypothetical protein QME05_01590 [Candidatus Margulisbacteria bacterium]|nr:hypothetical protein [Candidatus Margulisiibacteriota bacterium]